MVASTPWLWPEEDRKADGIVVVDLTDLHVDRVLESGADPEAFDTSPDGRTLFVSNEDFAQVSAVDVSTGRVRQRARIGREPEGVAVRPDGAFVYVTSEADNWIDVVRTSADTGDSALVTTIPTGQRPRAVLFSRDGSRAFTSNEGDASVTVIDGRAHVPIGNIALPADLRPMGLVLTPDERTLFVTGGRGRGIAVVDVADRRLRGDLPQATKKGGFLFTFGLSTTPAQAGGGTP